MTALTLSTSRNYDDAAIASWASGDTLTIDTGATLTFNSDNRWGQQAAVLGNITMSALLGGNLTIDGSTVWWIPFDASSGNVPVLGTVGTPDVTRGGSNVGEFLGVWTALGTAPLASGGAMPSSGFVKLRSKSTTLADNDVLTFTGGATITINSATGGQRGWISHFCGYGSIIYMSRQNIHTINGDWFDLGMTDGTDGQTFQHYVSDYCAGVEVETSPGSGVYEKFPSVYEGIGTPQRLPLTITACANNGSGLVRLTSAAHGLATGDQVIVAGVLGATGANGTFTVTVISTTGIDLQGSTFGGSWTSATGSYYYNGTATYPNAVPITSITNNGSGLVRVTTTHLHGITSGQAVKIAGVSDSGEVNGSWNATVVSTTVFDLNLSTYVSTYGAGGAVKQSAWNNRVLATNKYNITNIADSGNGYLRVTTNAPLVNKVSMCSGTPGAFASGTGNVMQFGVSYTTTLMGHLAYIESITGTGTLPTVGAYYPNVYTYAAYYQLNGTTFVPGSTITGGRIFNINTCVAPGTWQLISSMSSAPGTGYIRVNMVSSFPHGMNDGDQVYFKGIIGSGNCGALNGTVKTCIYVDDLTFDVAIAYTGGFTSGIMGDVKSGQTISFSGITGTGSISGLNGNSYKAIMIGPNTFDIPVLTAGGTYTSGGVIDNGDLRGKFVLADVGGIIKFGGPTTGHGYLPPSGCKVRVPNVHLSSSMPNAPFFNTPCPNFGLSNRARFSLAQGSIVWTGVNTADFSSYLSTPYNVSITNSHLCDQLYIAQAVVPFSLTNNIVAQLSDIGHGIINIVNCPAGGTATSCNFAHTNSYNYINDSAEIQYSNNITLTRCNVSCSQNGSTQSFSLLDCSGFSISNCSFQGPFTATSCPYFRFLNNTCADRSSHHVNGSSPI